MFSEDYGTYQVFYSAIDPSSILDLLLVVSREEPC